MRTMRTHHFLKLGAARPAALPTDLKKVTIHDMMTSLTLSYPDISNAYLWFRHAMVDLLYVEVEHPQTI